MDEDEVNKYILSSEETRIKQLIWNNLNKEWIEEQELKGPKKPVASVQKRKIFNKNESKNSIKLLMRLMQYQLW